MHRGWFAVHRKIFDSDVWQHPTAFIVWIYILGNVTHQEVTLSERYQAITLQPGQALTSTLAIAAKCRLSRRQTRSALNYLKSTNRVTIKATNRFTVITVTNFGPYREAMLGNDQQNDQQNDKHPTSRRPAADHIQEDLKKIEKKKKDLPLALAPSGGAADHPEDPPLAAPGALREALKEAGLIGQPSGPKDRGNGKDKSGGEGKIPKEQPLTPEQQRVYLETLAAVRRGDTTPEDGVLALQLQHGFTDQQAALAERVMTPGRTAEG